MYKLLKLPSISYLLIFLFAGNLMSAHVFAQAESDTNKKTYNMKFNNYAYIFLGPNLDPQKDRQTIKHENFTFTVVGMDFSEKEKVIVVAKELVAQGAQTLELCGGFGPIWMAKVSEAINNAVPVGGVFYGPEARQPMLDLLSSSEVNSKR